VAEVLAAAAIRGLASVLVAAVLVVAAVDFDSRDA
jgi:hypothetical protein